MVDQLDIQRPTDLFKMPGGRNVVLAGRWVTARVIVHEDEARGIMLESSPEYWARVDSEMPKSTVLQLLVRDEATRIVEKKDTQSFVGERAHRRDEVATEIGAERVNRDAPKIGGHRFESGIARADYQRDDGRQTTEDPP